MFCLRTWAQEYIRNRAYSRLERERGGGGYLFSDLARKLFENLNIGLMKMCLKLQKILRFFFYINKVVVSVLPCGIILWEARKNIVLGDMYIYVYTCIYICIYIYMYIQLTQPQQVKIEYTLPPLVAQDFYVFQL